MHVKFFLIGAEAKKLQQTTGTEQKKRIKRRRRRTRVVGDRNKKMEN